MLFFISPADCCFRKSEFNTTLLYQNEGEETQPQEHQHSCPILLQFRHSFPTLCKNHIKGEVDKKIQAWETLKFTKGFVFASYRCSKQSVSRLLTLNWSEHFIQWGCFQICCGIIHHYTCFFYKQLGSGLKPQSCLYFQDFGGSKLPNGCLVVWPSNRYLRGIQ